MNGDGNGKENTKKIVEQKSSGIITSNNINTEHYKMKSSAPTNSSIKMKSSRGNNLTSYYSSEVDRLKCEVILNYNSNWNIGCCSFFNKKL